MKLLHNDVKCHINPFHHSGPENAYSSLMLKEWVGPIWQYDSTRCHTTHFWQWNWI